MKKITTIQLQAVKVLTPNGFSHGLVTKRPATTMEVRHIMKNILSIVINKQDNMYDREEYEKYNKEMTQTFNEWLNGNGDDQSIMRYAGDCSDEPLGLFNAFKMADYLQKRGVI